MHQIKRAIVKPGRGSVRLDELNRQIPLLGELARELEHPRLSIEADYAAGSADPLPEQMSDTEDATAHIDRCAAGVDPDQVQQLGCLLGVDLGLLDKVANLRRTIAKQIPPGCADLTGPHPAIRLYPHRTPFQGDRKCRAGVDPAAERSSGSKPVADGAFTGGDGLPFRARRTNH